MSDGAGKRGAVRALGARVLGALEYLGGMALLLGAAGRWAFRGAVSRKARFGGRALAAQMVRVGVR
ncbi:MAG TPA: hypothetical protein PK082_04975, partial [Phycisphaerae bacterium]|nr:hypothetical protein [Phycisphaerae bacterium]